MAYRPLRSARFAGVRSKAIAAAESDPVFLLPHYEESALDRHIRDVAPSIPLYIQHPDMVTAQARRFQAGFCGRPLYAVKCNHDPDFLKQIYGAGITGFDVASLAEIKLIRGLFSDAYLCFMHTVKSPEAIRAAYFDYGVRVFSLDHPDELAKIIRSTDGAKDLTLVVRFAPPKNNAAAIDFSAKFGCTPHEAVRLLRKTRAYAARLGLAFHVGTQTEKFQAYDSALLLADSIIQKSSVPVDMLDIGGGFPADYPGTAAPALENFLSGINQAIKTRPALAALEIYGEPGRILVAKAERLIVRIELRKGNMLYINDGTYGGLFDAGPALRQKFKLRHIPAKSRLNRTAKQTEFILAGPTCDSLDMMAGPFVLPDHVQIGDWIEISEIGAYSRVLRTGFNGFDGHAKMIWQDDRLSPA